MKAFLELLWERRKGDIGLMELIFILASIIAVAVTLYVVMSFGKEGLVISYD